MRGGRIVRTVVTMATTTTRPARTQTAQAATPPEPGFPMSRREQLALAFFASWTVFGLYVDGWAHEHNKPETFFTPWHLLLYSGFVTGVLWTVVDGWRQKRAGVVAPGAVAGQRITAIAVAMFITGAITDGIWHEVLGVEVNLEALLSPTHLLLMFGGVMLVTAPLRAAWIAGDEPDAPTLRQFGPILVSTTLAVAVLSFFFMYVSAFDANTIGDRGLLRVANPQQQEWLPIAFQELRQIQGIMGVLVTNALLLGPVFLLLRRWRPPVGTFTILFGVIALGMVGMNGWRYTALALPAVLGGLTADVLIDRLQPGVGREQQARIVAVAVPLVLWLSYFATYHLGWTVGWSAEIWTGSVFLAVVSSLGLSLLAFPMRIQRAVET